MNFFVFWVLLINLSIIYFTCLTRAILIRTSLKSFLANASDGIVDTYFKTWPLKDTMQVIRLLSSNYYDFHQHYDNLLEKDDRQRTIWQLFKHPQLHPILFPISKILTNPLWADEFFKLSWSHSEPLRNSSFSPGSFKFMGLAYAFERRLKIAKYAFERFPQSIEETDWIPGVFTELNVYNQVALLGRLIFLANIKDFPAIMAQVGKLFELEDSRLSITGSLLKEIPRELWQTLIVKLTLGLRAYRASWYKNRTILLLKQLCRYSSEFMELKKRLWRGDIEEAILKLNQNATYGQADNIFKLVKILRQDYEKNVDTANFRGIILDVMADLLLIAKDQWRWHAELVLSVNWLYSQAKDKENLTKEKRVALLVASTSLFGLNHTTQMQKGFGDFREELFQEMIRAHRKLLPSETCGLLSWANSPPQRTLIDENFSQIYAWIISCSTHDSHLVPINSILGRPRGISSLYYSPTIYTNDLVRQAINNLLRIPGDLIGAVDNIPCWRIPAQNQTQYITLIVKAIYWALILGETIDMSMFPTNFGPPHDLEDFIKAFENQLCPNHHFYVYGWQVRNFPLQLSRTLYYQMRKFITIFGWDFIYNKLAKRCWVKPCSINRNN